MPERINPLLRMLCLVLAALIVYQLAWIVAQKDPLGPLSTVSASGSFAGEERGPKSTNAMATRGTAPQQAPIAPVIQTRIDRIAQSEILAAIVRPLPMALLGIAGKDAFLRTPNGQTGLLKEGEELGGVKLLKIGTNRVLIEHEQQQKELMLFSGFGSETLLPKGDKNPQ